MPWSLLGPIDFCRELPEFNSSGYIPPGDYCPPLDEFKRRFAEVPGRERRSEIFEGWCRHRHALLDRGAPPDAEAIVNGSYTSEKPEPGDLDYVVGFEVTNLDEFWELDSLIEEMLTGPDMKAEYDCDAYGVVFFPQDHEFWDWTQKLATYWANWFTRDRENRPKGRVWMEVGAVSTSPENEE